MYGQPELRPSILKSLKALVDSNIALSTASEEEIDASTTGLSKQDSIANVDFLRTQVESWLAVLFNVYGSVGRDSRGMVGDVINSWVSIAGEQVGLSSKYFRLHSDHLLEGIAQRLPEGRTTL